MEINTYNDLDIYEETHWWFAGRRRIIESFLQRYCPKAVCALDIGAGTGYNTLLLENYAQKVCALEPAEAAVKLFKNKNVTVFQSDLISFASPRQFDLVTLFDVLEHIEDDNAALMKIRGLISRGGKVILTVPAFSLLWSKHDEVHRHFRRYTKQILQNAVKKAGFTVIRMTYFNFYLFPIVLIVRTAGRFFPRERGSDFWRLPSLINTFLAWVFGSERHLLRFLNVPLGVSLICVLEKTE